METSFEGATFEIHLHLSLSAQITSPLAPFQRKLQHHHQSIQLNMGNVSNLFKSVVKDPSEAVVVLYVVSVLVSHQGGHQGLTVNPPDDNDMT